MVTAFYIPSWATITTDIPTKLLAAYSKVVRPFIHPIKEVVKALKTCAPICPKEATIFCVWVILAFCFATLSRAAPTPCISPLRLLKPLAIASGPSAAPS
jgi:hypothetical protein